MPFFIQAYVAGFNEGTNDGTYLSAQFCWPEGLALDQSGNIFVADTANSTIRRITPDGMVTTIGGLAGVSGNREETGLAARFNSPSGIAVDGNGVLYIADTANNRIVKGV